MKCPGCGHQVWCQACGADVESSQARAYRRRRGRGICARCPAKLTEREQEKGHVHCRSCRIKQAARSRRRYELKGRKDRLRKAAA
jgi:DNA-directed RNA polymerase subunit RPC12/RpoP